MPEPIAPPLERILSRPESGPRSIVDLALRRNPDPQAVDAARPPSAFVRMTRTVGSCPLKVPRVDWERVVCGTKGMYRTYSSRWRDRFARLVPEGEVLPRPVVIYTQVEHDKRYDFRMAVLLGYRQEPLGAMPEADLYKEGFVDERGPRVGMNRFRRYWKLRYKQWGWRPGDLISVVELRPWAEHDDEEQGAWLLRRLYGDWL